MTKKSYQTRINYQKCHSHLISVYFSCHTKSSFWMSTERLNDACELRNVYFKFWFDFYMLNAFQKLSMLA